MSGPDALRGCSDVAGPRRASFAGSETLVGSLYLPPSASVRGGTARVVLRSGGETRGCARICGTSHLSPRAQPRSARSSYHCAGRSRGSSSSNRVWEPLCRDFGASRDRDRRMRPVGGAAASFEARSRLPRHTRVHGGYHHHYLFGVVSVHRRPEVDMTSRFGGDWNHRVGHVCMRV